MAAEDLKRPRRLGARSAVALLTAAAAFWAYESLGLGLGELVPSEGGLEVAGRFFSRALSPALSSEARFVPPDSPPLLLNAARAAKTTVLFASAAMGLAIVLGLVLGFLASTAWWDGDPAGARSPLRTLLRRTVGPAVFTATRALIAFLRSVHELLWAVLFLVALGLSNVAAVLAIAIPYSGVFAKVFAEMVDEAPRQGALALRGAGASNAQVYAFGLIPSALPDLIAYAFYRMECAIRSAAILGFFGYPTLGLYIRQSFSSTNYGEVWTYLYALILVVVLFDVWSFAVRRRVFS